ncbi:ATP-binding protein [Streptomyces iconiensis]|uniref:ATP-binding protein n=1 Tax=Streptomyces iconiensis TaxID=1384038 RepID=A0ABT7A5E2_9ACTN|nr:ATP-binding protein [Streptomyces iconiensis]MDJ1136287.1 ATP-binding protein [Streptomyces iconiensis]
MTATAVEPCGGQLPLLAEDIRDDLSLRILRTPRASGAPVPGYEARWVERCRRIGAAKLRHWSMPGLIENAQLLISELVTNALRHGDGSSDTVVRFVITADRLLIAVDDGSPGTARVRDAGVGDETGRGMLLVAAFATQWGVSPDGSTTWCSLAVEGAT